MFTGGAATAAGDEAATSKAVVSSDHADESLCVAGEGAAARAGARGPRLFSAEEVASHDGQEGGSAFWAVVDGFVVDASDLVDAHPGGLRKLLSTNAADVGATGAPFGFSFSRGRNAHFPATGQRFRDGVLRYLAGEGAGEGASSNGSSSSSSGACGHLPPEQVVFEDFGAITILGRLRAA